MKFFGYSFSRRTVWGQSLLFIFLAKSSIVFAAGSADKALEDKLFSSDPNPDVSNEYPSGADSAVTVEETLPPEVLETSRSRERAKKFDESVTGPKQIPNEHIFVVQNRYVRKEGAHEITPIQVGLQPGDSFRKQLQWGFSYAYHFSESIGIEALHATVLTNYNSGLANAIRTNTSSKLETYRPEPVFTLGTGFLWTPLHSKAATDQSVYHFEGYFIIGGGITRAEDKSVGMAMGGFGFRAYMSKRALFKVEIRDYVDFHTQVDQRVSVLVGASLLLGGGS